MAVSVRDATIDDMVAVNRLYNATVPDTTVSWTETLEPLEHRVAWFEAQQREGRPVLVATLSTLDDEVIGFSSYGSFRGDGRWPGYRHTVEHTIHVDERCRGVGVGSALMTELLVRAARGGVHVVVGAVDGANDASLGFHERLGFVEVARMPEVGRKFGRWLDLVFVQRIVDAAAR